MTLKSILLVSLFLTFNLLQQQAKLPEMNEKIIEYCKSQLGKKVGRGECWDLAKSALDANNAQWERPYNFGKKINFQNVKIYPGDIVQFENVVLKDGRRMKMTIKHHTAIIYQVLGPKKFSLIHQNVNGKRKVMISDIDLKYLKRGKIYVYRPQSK